MYAIFFTSFVKLKIYFNSVEFLASLFSPDGQPTLEQMQGSQVGRMESLDSRRFKRARQGQFEIKTFEFDFITRREMLKVMSKYFLESTAGSE